MSAPYKLWSFDLLYKSIRFHKKVTFNLNGSKNHNLKKKIVIVISQKHSNNSNNTNGMILISLVIIAIIYPSSEH